MLPCVQAGKLEQIFRTVGRKVRAKRTDLGWSQEEAAHHADMTSRQWQRVEAGRGVSLRTLVSVATALGIELSDLLKR